MKDYASLDELLKDLPALAAKAGDALKDTEGLFLLEESAGRRLYVKVDRGEVTLPESPDGEPVCTVCASESDLLAVISGRMKPMSAILRGKVRLKGNPAPLLALIKTLA